MIKQTSLCEVIVLARKYGVGKMYLVGSALRKTLDNINDYDFAVKDVPKVNFFKFYGELFGIMPKNVDLIDLSGKPTKFKKLVA